MARRTPGEDMHWIRLIERIFVIAGFFLYSDAFLPLLKKGHGWVGPVEKLLYYLVPLLTLFFLIIYRRSVGTLLVKEKFFWLLLGLALASITWSSAHGATLQAIISLIRVVLFGIYFSARFTLREQIRVLAVVFGFAVISSLMFGLFYKNYGVMGMGLEMTPENIAHAGSWRGIFTHKNVLGRFMTLAAIVFLIFSPQKQQFKYLKWIFLSLTVLVILLSTSKSSLIILLTITSILPLFKSLKWNYNHSIPFIITLLVLLGSAITLFLDNAEIILNAMGKDMTLTGRTDLWNEVIRSISERPFLGYGLGGFWRGLKGNSEVIITTMKWDVPHAHNGYLDILVDLGFLGFLAFLLSFTFVFFRSIVKIRSGEQTESLFPIIFLTFLVMTNLTESSFFRQGFMIIFYTSVTLSTHQIKKAKENKKYSVSLHAI
jgi:exopolysaccharide production protein ExoQ